MVAVFEFDAEWEDAALTNMETSGYRGVVKLGGVRVGKAPNVLWDKAAAIEDAQEFLCRKMEILLHD